MLRRSVIRTVVLLPVLAACSGDDRDDDADDDAAQWRIDYVTDSREAQLTAVVATSRDEGWAVGMDADKDVIVLHRQGRVWKPAADLPVELSRYEGADLSAPVLAASGHDNVWLFTTLGSARVGTPSGPGAIRWDGQRWQKMPGDFYVRDVAVLAPDNVWALGATSVDTGVVHHWDGTSWTGTRLPIYYPDRLSATGPDDIWASGSNGAPARNDVRPATAHFDGKQWTDVPVPNQYAQADVVDIVAHSPTDAWAIGTDRDVMVFALHWDGSTWNQVPNAVANGGKFGHRSAPYLASDGAGGFVLAARYEIRQQYTAGGTVRMIKDPKPVAGRSDKVTDVDRDQHFQPHGLTWVPGTREVWAVGAVGLGQIHGDKSFSRGVVASYTWS